MTKHQLLVYLICLIIRAITIACTVDGLLQRASLHTFAEKLRSSLFVKMKKVAISSKTTESCENNWRASLEKGYSEPFTMQTTSTDQVHCTELCSLHTRIVVQSCSYAPISERMPNYANNYAGIIRRCLGLSHFVICRSLTTPL